MGRRSSPIADTGPLGRFAAELVELKDTVPGTTYRSMAHRCNFSHAVLAEAARGRKLPTWEVVKAFVTALGANEEEVRDWEKFWAQTRDEMVGQHRRVGGLDVVIPVGAPAADTAAAGVGRGRLRPVTPDLVEPARTLPRPEAVRTYDDLLHELAVLRIHAGQPSLNGIREGMRQFAVRRGRDTTVGKSTLSEILTGRRTPPRDLFLCLVEVLLHTVTPDGNHDVTHSYDHIAIPTDAAGQVVRRTSEQPGGQSMDIQVLIRQPSTRPPLADASTVADEFKTLQDLLEVYGAGRLRRMDASVKALVERGTWLASVLPTLPPAEQYFIVTDLSAKAPGVVFSDNLYSPIDNTFNSAGLPSLNGPGWPGGTAHLVTVRPSATGPDMQGRMCVVFADPGGQGAMFAVLLGWRPSRKLDRQRSPLPRARGRKAPTSAGRGDVRPAGNLPGWRRLETWGQSWAAAEYNRRRPDLTRPKRYGTVVLLQPERDAGPAPGILAAMPPEQAAALLGTLPESVAATLLGEMPGDRAQAVLKAMLPRLGTPDGGRDAFPRDWDGNEGGVSLARG